MSETPDVDADSHLEGLLSPDEAESVRQRSAAVGAAVGAIVGGRRGPVAAGVAAGTGAAAGYLVGAFLTPTRDEAVLDATDPALAARDEEPDAVDVDDGPVRIDIEEGEESKGDDEPGASDDEGAGDRDGDADHE